MPKGRHGEPPATKPGEEVREALAPPFVGNDQPMNQAPALRGDARTLAFVSVLRGFVVEREKAADREFGRAS